MAGVGSQWRYDEAQVQRRLWTPALLRPNLSVWLDAADISTITVATGVSQWLDKSGNGRTVSQSSSNNQPTYERNGLNDRNVISFGIDDFLLFSTSVIDYRSVALVYTHPDTRLFSTFIGSVPSGGAGAFHGGVSTVFSSSYTATETLNGINRHNGVSIGNGTTTNRPTTPTVAVHVPTGVQTARGLTAVGADNRAADRTIAGIVSEIIIANVPWNKPSYETVEGYLAWKWGLQSKLSASHPFVNRPPLIGD